jgi:hypothetical protein
VACAAAAPAKAPANREPGAASLRATTEALLARWDADAPLSDHDVTLAIDCEDDEPDRPQSVEPGMIDAMVPLPRSRRVTGCTGRCCTVAEGEQPCFDARDQLDRVIIPGRCRGD